jgi:hypothetical protein
MNQVTNASFPGDNPDEEQQAAEELKEMGFLIVQTPFFGHVTTILAEKKSMPPRAIELLIRLKNLNTVIFSGTDIQDDQLLVFSKLDQLSCLALNSTSITDVGLKHLENLTSLAALHLIGTKISDDGLESLAKIPHLTILDLSKTNVKGRGLKYLWSLKELVWLILLETSLTDGSLKAVENYPALKRISLSKNHISSPDIDALKQAKPDLMVG